MHESVPQIRRIAVVTGASSGIGAATARRLAADGFFVVCVARRVERLITLANEIGGRAVPCDVTDPEQVIDLAASVGERCDVLVNNAGGAFGLEPVAEADLVAWQAMYAINVLGAAAVTQAFLPSLVRSSGLVIFITSVAADGPYEGGAGYCGAKAAERAIAGAMRLELLGQPVRIAEISPGMVHTEEFTLNRFGGDQARADATYAGVPDPLTGDDIAECISWVASLPPHVNIERITVRPLAQAAQHKIFPPHAMSDHDAIVIGSGPNGLVAANLLVDAGWDVVLLESQDRIGGGVQSDDDVAPGFVHDTFSSFYPLAAASPVIKSLGLERYGLTWRQAPAVLGNPLPGGGWALLHRDVEDTAAALDRLQPGDGAAWRELCAAWSTIGPALVESLLTPFPPVRGGLKTLFRLPRVGGLDFVRTLLEPAVTMGRTRFTGPAAQLLIAGNAMHADISLHAPGSGLVGLLLAMSGQRLGFPVPEGGAGKLSESLAARFRAAGGEIRVATRATRVVVDRGRVHAVLTEHGERLAARAVVADVSATALYGDLVGWSDLPDRVRRRMRRFELDPATIKVDWALSSPVPWADPPDTPPGTVHITDSLDALSDSQDAVNSHAIPAHPFLLVGQLTTTDPTRSPVGTESLWAYTHVPQEVKRDLGEDGLTGAWDASEVERMADRMQARIEALAPDFASTIIARRVLGPYELQARNENLIKGSLGGGTSGLHQQVIFRPMAGLGRADTAIRGLFLGSASAHPGGGVHGACGANAARAVIAAARLGRL